MVKTIRIPMTIVVLNNNGGGIFSYLPIAKFQNEFETYFGTPHELKFRNAAQMFSINYQSPCTNEDFIQTYRHSLSSRLSTIIEITTKRSENIKIVNKLQLKFDHAINKIIIK